MRALALMVVSAVSLCCGNTHPLLEGSYTFTRTGVVRDDCGEAGRADLMSGGAYQSHGHEVRFDNGFYSVRLVGQYLVGTESFRLDGSVANVTTQVQGRECLLDLITMTLEATGSGTDAFAGTLSAKYEANRPVDCDCQTWVQFSATRVP